MAVRVRSRSVGTITGSEIKITDGSHDLGPFTNNAGTYCLPVDVQAISGDIAKNTVQTNGTQKTQLVDASANVGEFANVGGEKALKVDVIATVGGGGGGTAMTDLGSYTPTATQFTPIGGEMDDVAPSLLTEGKAGAARSTPYRALHVSLRKDSDGTELLGQKAMAASIPVTVASDQAAFPVSQSGSNWSTNVAQINGVAVSMGSGIMGTGVQRVAIASDNDPVPTKSTAANAKVDIGLINAVTPLMGSGIMGTGSLRVTVASDNDPITVKQGTAANLKALIDINAAQTLATVTTVSTVTSLTQMNGAAIAMNTGVRAAGVQRVTICTDDVVPASQSGTWTVQPGNTANTTPWLIDVNKINAVTPLMGNGTTGTGSLRVTLASDTSSNTNPFYVNGGAAYGAAAVGNPLRCGAKAYDALLTGEAAGDQMDLIADKQGRLIIAGSSPPDLVKFQTTNNANTTETTIVTAGGAGVFNDILCLIATNKSSVQSKLSLRDATGGTVRMVFLVPANGGIVINPNTPMAQTTAANNWTMQMGTTASDTDVSVMYTTRK
jgi:hypothetical protein